MEDTEGKHAYEVVERLATGTFGVVYKVCRTADNEVLVMKRIPLQELNRAERVEATQEMLLMSDLHHPFVVAQRDAFLYNDNDLCLIMDYYDGGDLDLTIARQRDVDVYFDFDQVMLWFVEMVLALEYLHSHHILHRDVKTHNLFLCQRTNAIAVGDFGIAERIDGETANAAAAAAATWRQHQLVQQQTLLMRRRSSSSTSLGGGTAEGSTPRLLSNGVIHRRSSAESHSLSPKKGSGSGSYSFAGAQSSTRPAAVMKGTPLYMAPETLQGDGSGTLVGPTADVWSLGCILYELLCLRHPFESRDIGALVMRVTHGEREPLPPHYPPAVHELVDWMLTIDPQKRPTCAEVLRAPIAAAYLRQLRARHVPTAGPDAPEEAALAEQLREFCGGATGPDADDFKKQVGPPSCPPSREREAAEARRREAAQRAAVHLMGGNPGSAHSSTTNLTGGGGLHRGAGSAGTFFCGGATPFGHTAEGGGGGPPPVSYAGQHAEELDTPSSPGDDGLHAHAGRREDMSSDDSDEASEESSHGGDEESDGVVTRSPPGPEGGGPPAKNPQRDGSSPAPLASGDGGGGPPKGRRERSTAAASRSPPTSGPRQDRGPSPSTTAAKRLKGGKDFAGRPPVYRPVKTRGTTAAAAARRLELEGGSEGSPTPTRDEGGKGKGRRAASPSLEEVFFCEHDNVRDMRSQPIAVIAEAVMRMRVLVELGLRERQRQRDAHGYLARFGDDLASSMPTTFREAAGRWSSSAGDGPRHDMNMKGRQWLSSAPLALAASPPPPDVRAPDLAVQQRAAKQPSLMRYLQRRTDLVTLALKELSPEALAAVYAYYQRTSITQRDPLEVLKIVPERGKWSVLPFIEDVVVLDRYLEGGSDPTR